MVFYGEELPVGGIGSAQRSVDVFVLHKAGVRCPVRIDKAVQAEVAVVLKFAVVAAVPIHRLSIVSQAFVDGVVAPLPDEAAAEGGVFLGKIQILFEIAGAVAHGVAVFHKQKRLFRVVVQIVRDFIEARVHAADDVDVRHVVFAVESSVVGALVGGQPRGVCLFSPAQSGFESAPVPALIAHGPDKDAGAVAVTKDHGADPVHCRLDEIGIVSDPDMSPAHALVVVVLVEGERTGAMALVISLVYDVESHRVAELIEPGRIGIVTGADCIEIMSLNHLQIFHSLIDGDDCACERIRFVAVDAPESDRSTVKSQYEIPYFNAAEADLFCDDFAPGVHDQGVEDRIFSAPQRGLVHVDGDKPVRFGRDGTGKQCSAIRALQSEADRDGRSAELKAES